MSFADSQDGQINPQDIDNIFGDDGWGMLADAAAEQQREDKEAYERLIGALNPQKKGFDYEYKKMGYDYDARLTIFSALKTNRIAYDLLPFRFHSEKRKDLREREKSGEDLGGYVFAGELESNSFVGGKKYTIDGKECIAVVRADSQVNLKDLKIFDLGNNSYLAYDPSYHLDSNSNEEGVLFVDLHGFTRDDAGIRFDFGQLVFQKGGKDVRLQSSRFYSLDEESLVFEYSKYLVAKLGIKDEAKARERAALLLFGQMDEKGNQVLVGQADVYLDFNVYLASYLEQRRDVQYDPKFQDVLISAVWDGVSRTVLSAHGIPVTSRHEFNDASRDSLWYRLYAGLSVGRMESILFNSNAGKLVDEYLKKAMKQSTYTPLEESSEVKFSKSKLVRDLCTNKEFIRETKALSKFVNDLEQTFPSKVLGYLHIYMTLRKYNLYLTKSELEQQLEPADVSETVKRINSRIDELNRQGYRLKRVEDIELKLTKSNRSETSMQCERICHALVNLAAIQQEDLERVFLRSYRAGDRNAFFTNPLVYQAVLSEAKDVAYELTHQAMLKLNREVDLQQCLQLVNVYFDQRPEDGKPKFIVGDVIVGQSDNKEVITQDVEIRSGLHGVVTQYREALDNHYEVKRDQEKLLAQELSERVLPYSETRGEQEEILGQEGVGSVEIEIEKNVLLFLQEFADAKEYYEKQGQELPNDLQKIQNDLLDLLNQGDEHDGLVTIESLQGLQYNLVESLHKQLKEHQTGAKNEQFLVNEDEILEKREERAQNKQKQKRRSHRKQDEHE